MSTNAPELARAFTMLEQHLRWRKAEGDRKVLVEPATLAALAPRPSQAAAPTMPARTPARPLENDMPPRRPAPAPGPTLDALPAAASLEEVASRIATCRRCGLCDGRTKTVPGQGHAHPDILFVGEGPGREEDEQGLAFVGRAGQLLTRMIVAMGLTRDDVFIGNIVKCRPTEDGKGIKDRPPTREEMNACLPYLHQQIELLQPKAIIALGGSAVKGLFGDEMTGITRLRGKWLSYRGIDVMPTFHPSYLLRQGGENKDAFWAVWEDLALVLRKLGKPVPERKRG